MKCKAKTKAGKPCRANAVKGSDYCIVHAKQFDQKSDSTAKAESTDKAKETVKADVKKQPSPAYVKSTQTGTKPLWEKGVTRMDEKKNVGFIPGLALILAVLALVLISINAVKPTPSVEAMEQSFDKKIVSLSNSILAQVKSGNVIANNVATKLFERDLINLETSLANFSTMGGPEMAQDLAALKDALAKVKARMNPAPAE